ncbi:hypothetical protein ABR738_00465 [Streptomyces sp. Edi4]|uniref:hypothetical protein n=1 Tax=Streptomyces sp. Edi4 TaxID=3162527 RepID=UPI003305A84E
MFRRLLDSIAEVRDHHALSKDINEAVASGDREAAAAFTSRTGTLAAALTRSGNERRGAEISDYATHVADADGNTNRVHRLGRSPR